LNSHWQKRFASQHRSCSPISILANVGQANLHYMGSITLNSQYASLGIHEGMLCQINNLRTKERLYTYVIYDNNISKHDVCLNGAAAHRVSLNDKVEIQPMFVLEGQSGNGGHVMYNSFADSPSMGAISLNLEKYRNSSYYGITGKLHTLRITATHEDASVPFVGVAEDAAKLARIPEGSMVHLVDVNTGARHVLPVVYLPAGTGRLEVSGIKNRHSAGRENVFVDDIVILMAYASVPWSLSVQNGAIRPFVIVPTSQEKCPVKTNLSLTRLLPTESEVNQMGGLDKVRPMHYIDNLPTKMDSAHVSDFDFSKSKAEYVKLSVTTKVTIGSCGNNAILIPRKYNIADHEFMHVFNRNTGFSCWLAATNTDEPQVGIRGDISRHFDEEHEVVVTATCLSPYGRTDMELQFDRSMRTLRGQVNNGQLAISNFIAQKSISLPMESRPNTNEMGPYGVYASDAFLQEHGVQHGDLAFVCDANGNYNWDVLRSTEGSDSFATGYSNLGPVDIHVCSSVDQANPYFSLSSYWKMILPLFWDYTKLASDFQDLAQQRFPGRSPSEISILDASCGSGELGFELAKLGYDVDMSDAAPNMIKLAAHTAETKYELQPVCSGNGFPRADADGQQTKKRARLGCHYWSELAESEFVGGKKYDMILVRGNSTPYVNGLWDNLKVDYDEKGTIREMIASMRSLQACLKPGGLLYLDKCHEEDSQVREYTRKFSETCESVKVAGNDGSFFPSTEAKLESLHWVFETDALQYTRRWTMDSDIALSPVPSSAWDASPPANRVNFHGEVNGFFLTEKVLMGISRHLGFATCSRYDLANEKMYKGYLLETVKQQQQDYYDRALSRYLDVWLDGNPRNAAINWGKWDQARSWQEAQDERYSAMVASLHKVFNVAKEGQKVRVLDIGCGTGYTLWRLEKEFGEAFEGVGIDPSSAEIEFAQKEFGSTQTRFDRKFLHELATEKNFDSFDIILSESAICHMPPDERSLAAQQMYALLKSGGLLWFNDPVTGSKVSNVETEVFVMERLGFKDLWGIDQWHCLLQRAGFAGIQAVDNGLSQARSYRYLSKVASRKGYEELAQDYDISANNISRGTFSWAWFEANKP